jgi:hypothetical protein
MNTKLLPRGKDVQKMWADSVLFKKLPKFNNFPTGKNSPYLVTLFETVNGKEVQQTI